MCENRQRERKKRKQKRKDCGCQTKGLLAIYTAQR